MNLNGKRILMTTGGGLGDMICFTPALRRMKELYPDVRITFMTKRGNHEVMQGLPYLEKVIYIIRGKAFGRYRVLPDFWHQDAVVFTDWQPQLLLFSKLFRIPVRAGIPRPGHTLDGFLTKHLKTNVMKSRNYAAETNARLFSEALGIELDGPMDRLDVAMPSERVQSETAALLESIGLEDGQPFLLLSPFASMEQRNWPADSVRAFVQRAEAELHLPVVISAPPQQAELAASFSRYSLAGRTGTMQLVELVRRARLLVTPDSGPDACRGGCRHGLRRAVQQGSPEPLGAASSLHPHLSRGTLLALHGRDGAAVPNGSVHAGYHGRYGAGTL